MISQRNYYGIFTSIHKNRTQTFCKYHQFFDEFSGVLPMLYHLCDSHHTFYKYERLGVCLYDHKTLWQADTPIDKLHKYV